MLTRDNSIVFIAAQPDACGLWRTYVPHFAVPNSTFYCFAQRPNFDLITSCDIAVVQRCCTPPQFEFLKICRVLGIKVVLDLDDDIFNLPEYNPAHAVFKQFRQGFDMCIRMTDVLSVSTSTLAKAVRRNVKGLKNMVTGKDIPIIVAENRINIGLAGAPVINHELIVGWAGSNSHIGDLPIIEQAVINLSPALQHVGGVFEIRGMDIPAALSKVPNIRYKPWTPVAEYFMRMPRWGWSIALAPLTDHEFNTSKSSIKMVESGYCGIPCLASHIKPYESFCHWDKELQWLLCAGKNSWEPKLRELICDKARREELGKRMRKVVDEHYSFSTKHEGWQSVIDIAKAI